MGIDFKFTGCGSGFHPELGSNSAYFLEKDSGMVLIDCGEGTFAKLSTNNDYLHAASMKVFITHTHGDHVGSLGTLVMHSWYALHRKTTIITADKRHDMLIRELLGINGVPRQAYTTIITGHSRYDEFMDPLRTAQYIPTSHVSEIPSYAIEFNRPEHMTYWTGDSNDYMALGGLMSTHKKEHIDMIYADCSFSENPVHMDIHNIESILPDESWKGKITMMHFNGMHASDTARAMGYKTAIDLMV